MSEADGGHRTGSKGLVVVAGGVARRHTYGGHVWVFLQYLLGLRRLGWEVLLVDRLDPDEAAPNRQRPIPVAHTDAIRRLFSILRVFDLDGACSVLVGADATIGLPRSEVAARLRDSAVLVNVMGYLDDPALRDLASTRIFLDIDPGFPQLWAELGLHDGLANHHHYATFGLNVGQPDCTVPTRGIDWIHTVPPVILEHWPFRPITDPSFTTVASWRGPFGPIEHEGRRLGLRVHEFRRLLPLPARTGGAFTLALDIDPADAADRDALAAAGWCLADPATAAGDPFRYQRFIRRSGAELSVAKQLYVQTRSGWFSDRSACYLATGRPVIALDTGFGHGLPVGKGLLSYEDLDGATRAVKDVMSDAVAHGLAARELAESRFDSDVVLPSLLRAAGVS